VMNMKVTGFYEETNYDGIFSLVIGGRSKHIPLEWSSTFSRGVNGPSC
jgi:hypothetical protein